MSQGDASAFDDGTAYASVRGRTNDANLRVIEIRRVKAQQEDRQARRSDRRLNIAACTLLANASDVEDDICQVKNQSGHEGPPAIPSS